MSHRSSSPPTPTPASVAPWMRRNDSTTSHSSNNSALFSLTSNASTDATSFECTKPSPAEQAQDAWATTNASLTSPQPAIPAAPLDDSPTPQPRKTHASQAAAAYHISLAQHASVHLHRLPYPNLHPVPPAPLPNPHRPHASEQRAPSHQPYTLEYQSHQGAGAYDQAGRYVSEQQRWSALKANHPLPRPGAHARTPSGTKPAAGGYFPLSVAAGVRLPKSTEPSPVMGARELPPRMMAGGAGAGKAAAKGLSADAPAFDATPVKKSTALSELPAPLVTLCIDPSPGPAPFPSPSEHVLTLPQAKLFHTTLDAGLSAQRRLTLAEHLADLAAARATNPVTTVCHIATFEEGERLRRVRYESQDGAVWAVKATLGEEEAGLRLREVERKIAEWLRG